jgi:methylmalonyl-CoA mutase cobalamin-binding subunit
VIAICGLDESYREMGVALAEALKESLPGAVLVLAGLPDDERRARLEEAGVEHFLHLRCDLLALLESLAVHEGVRP